MVRQQDGAIRAFFNVCMHRGNRLLSVSEGSVSGAFTCPYHGWKWGLDGVLGQVQDPEDFPQGNPCGKLTLKELRCETWGGFIFWSFDPNAPALLDYLEPLYGPDHPVVNYVGSRYPGVEPLIDRQTIASLRTRPGPRISRLSRRQKVWPVSASASNRVRGGRPPPVMRTRARPLCA